MNAGSFLSATISSVKPAGQYKMFVRLPGSTPIELTSYPGDDGAALEGQLMGSPLLFAFQNRVCSDANQVASSDGSFCVCAKGNTEDTEAANPTEGLRCKPCPQGFYKDDIDSIACQECDVKRTTIHAGSTYVLDCICETGYVSHQRMTCCLALVTSPTNGAA